MGVPRRTGGEVTQGRAGRIAAGRGGWCGSLGNDPGDFSQPWPRQT